MSIKTLINKYFISHSIEYIINWINKLMTEGDETLMNKAELCRLKRELFYYFIHKLEELKELKKSKSDKFNTIYTWEYIKILSQLKLLDKEAAKILINSIKTKEIVEPVARNVFINNIDLLTEKYAESIYSAIFSRGKKMIDAHMLYLERYVDKA